MVRSSTILTIPPRRHDLINDYGWKVRVDTDEGSTYFRFGSRTYMVTILKIEDY